MNSFQTIAGIALVTVSVMAHGGQWYKGDLHNHSLHSDGDSSVADVIASAESRELDFFVLTDHDGDMNGEPTHWWDPEYQSSSMILLYGVEWTTGDGHANVWAEQPYDYAPLWQAHQNSDPQAAVDAAHTAGALFSINHPVRLDWKYPVPTGVDAIEVWNGAMLINDNFHASNDFWDDALLQSGTKITGVGGSDTHNLEGILSPFQGHGNPSTWVYAETPTPQGILDGIKAGHVSISATYDDYRVELDADADGDGNFEAMMGDTVFANGNEVDFRLNIAGSGSGTGDMVQIPSSIVKAIDGSGKLKFWDAVWMSIQIALMENTDDLRMVMVVKNGDAYTGWLTSGGVDEINFSDTPNAGSKGYYRVEVFGEPKVKGLNKIIFAFRTALTNPIYVNY
ncbi:MAG: hypothetical protein D6B28_08305 [Gammaproteobacteria bacterium]|nr:MAG: hypothetical protein D6B28_08305 [Gammaproteobacteria bacterium]